MNLIPIRGNVERHDNMVLTNHPRNSGGSGSCLQREQLLAMIEVH